MKMLHRLVRASAVLALGGFAFVNPALAVTTLSLDSAASLVIPIQDEENKELWQDLRPDVTPPEAAVGNEGENPRGWEKATNQTDCEKAAGLWDANASKCSEKKGP
jgi:hypothetical protein